MPSPHGNLVVLCAAIPLVAACAATPPNGATHVYYVSAEETDWNYAPSGNNVVSGTAFNPIENEWAAARADRIGLTYRKAIYREYTDSTFSTLKPRAPEWEHLGILGPLLRASVGDTIRVVFRNRATMPYSMHPHGVIYNKDSEGSPYVDDTKPNEKADDAVPPGGTHTYVWPVPERAGPASGDQSSVLWMYHSHTFEPSDINAGLVGPMIITRRGNGGPDGRPTDVDREFVVMFGEFDENASGYLQHNIDSYTLEPKRVKPTLNFADPFYVSNLRETLNGLSFGNLATLRMKRGERVRWYIFATSNFELHAPHWHGQTVVANHMRTDALALLTMQMVVADMVPDNPGTWLFHCHVVPHLVAGMQGRFTVE